MILQHVVFINTY